MDRSNLLDSPQAVACLALKSHYTSLNIASMTPCVACRLAIDYRAHKRSSFPHKYSDIYIGSVLY